MSTALNYNVVKITCLYMFGRSFKYCFGNSSTANNYGKFPFKSVEKGVTESDRAVNFFYQIYLSTDREVANFTFNKNSNSLSVKKPSADFVKINKFGPQSLLCLFMFRPITLKQLNSST